ncbi:AraC family transcriptional regulator [Paenibacillus psychroresistens]|uniref:AraC family transcriptional regulator n=1 Tax=Paenibacillus psychroresistens TaxID=1778678 RepID=A0A6B8RRI6_9BACL|nr:GyrI-like domain-containing protein [Paenibacillus psychroresistens]QGQ99000.1 AraC family transcriptional regulator [Paenibacillus psychroresistens]
MDSLLNVDEQVKLIKLGEMKMVGFPVIVAFKEGDFSKIDKTKQQFMERRNEILNVIDPNIYWAPWFSCDVMFTYFYCLQVSEWAEIPHGMMSFTIPEAEYAAVHYSGPHPMDPDPYDYLAIFRQKNNIELKEKGMVLEKYRFDQNCEPGVKIALDVFGPIKSEI